MTESRDQAGADRAGNQVGDQLGDQVDVVVIGMGPGGEEVAGRLAEAGLRVVGVERELVGGECPYWGCVPSKMIIRAANLLAETRRVDKLAGHATVRPDFGPVARRIRDEATDDWDDTVAVKRFEKKGGTLVRGSARLVGPRQVQVGDTIITARRGVVLATGSAPVVPPIDGLAQTRHWTNREAIAATSAPVSLAVLGAGAVGMELAQAFARFGSQVTVIEAADRVLPAAEPEAADVVEQVLRAEGLELRLSVRATRVAREGDTVTVWLDDGTAVQASELLVAVGRRARVAELGVDTVGLDPKARAIEVDEWMRAGDGLWAVGDVTGVGPFTHMAMYQAGIAIQDILGRREHPADYRGLASVTFTDPEVGAVGLIESAARDRGLRVRVGSTPVSRSTRGWIHGPGNDGILKLVEDADRGVLVGATSCGPWGGEVLSMLTLAVHAQVPVETLRTMIYAYPTFHRGLIDALDDLAQAGGAASFDHGRPIPPGDPA